MQLIRMKNTTYIERQRWMLPFFCIILTVVLQQNAVFTAAAQARREQHSQTVNTTTTTTTSSSFSYESIRSTFARYSNKLEQKLNTATQRYIQRTRQVQQVSTIPIQTPFRINCGNTTTLPYTVPATNEVWQKDQYFRGPGIIQNFCSNNSSLSTIIPNYEMYCVSRLPRSEILYVFPVLMGETYYMKLHFLEPFWKLKGRRIVNIAIQDIIVMSNVDYTRDFGYNTPRSVVFGPITTNTNTLSLSIRAVLDRPHISGIEILKTIDTLVSSPVAAPAIIPTIVPIRTPTSTPSISPIKSTILPINTPTLLPTTVPIGSSTLSPIVTTHPTRIPTMPLPIITIPPIIPALFSPTISPTITVTASPILEIPTTGMPVLAPTPGPSLELPLPTLTPTMVSTSTNPISKAPITTTTVPTSVPFSTEVPSQPQLMIPSVEPSFMQVPFPFVLNSKKPAIVPTPLPITTTLTPSAAPELAQLTPSMPPVLIRTSQFPAIVTPAPTMSPIAPGFLEVPVYLNCGYLNGTYTDTRGKEWLQDSYVLDPLGISQVVDLPVDTPIHGTFDDNLFRNVRVGTSFGYELPLPRGNYIVYLHFVEFLYDNIGDRMFDVQVGTNVLKDVDILRRLGRSKKFTKMTLDFHVPIEDGPVTILLSSQQTSSISNGLPMIAGLEIHRTGPHLMHAVAGGPYVAVDTQNRGWEWIDLDGSGAHTHSSGATIEKIEWYENGKLLSNEVKPRLKMSVGEHEIVLKCEDSEDSTSYEDTIVTIQPYGYPTVTSLFPPNGTISGMDTISIIGHGFSFVAEETFIHFGDVVLSGSQITIVNSSVIQILSPSSVIAKEVTVTVETPRGKSADLMKFLYQKPITPIKFTSGFLASISRPTVARFGPDNCLYVGNQAGEIHRFKIDFSGEIPIVISSISRFVGRNRTVLGIAFDPTETNTTFPKVYFSHQQFFHGESKSTSGLAINGQIGWTQYNGRVFGAVTTVITGLPISDHDHGLNAIVFGNNGELFMTNGCNTNGGKPGVFSSSGLLKESFLSGAINVAYLRDPNFNGTITYTSPDDGDMIASGIEVYAHGIRNPYGLIMHSNGYLYATDNGPNLGYGNMLTGCGAGEFIEGQTDRDKLLHIEKGNYYGHPNPKRAAALNDPRQCKWMKTDSEGGNGYTPPIGILTSSMDGFVEFHANYFDGQLRGDLIMARFQFGLYRVSLTPDGNSTIVETRSGISMNIGEGLLDITMAPDGTLIEVRNRSNQLAFQKPIEPPTPTMKVLTVFPHRGRSTGGNTMSVHGINFDSSTSVTVAGLPCQRSTFISPKQIDCILPGSVPGLVDITVQKGIETSSFLQGYRYVV